MIEHPGRQRNQDDRNQIEYEGYPAPKRPTARSCPGCGTPTETDYSRCDFCLRDQADSSADGDEWLSDGWEFYRLIFALIEASNDYVAIAKGTAACTLLARRDDSPIENIRLVDDLREPPSTFLNDEWDNIPAIARTAGDTGERLLEQIRNRTTWEDETESKTNDATYLYDEAGDGVPFPTRFTTLRNDATEPVWLVPAIALQQTPAFEEVTET